MRRFEFIKPQIKVERPDEATNYARVLISPVERGYGYTLGNALRRVLLSSMPGVAIMNIQIEGAPHEFMALPGVREDITGIILNIKNIIFKIDDAKLFKPLPKEAEEIYELSVYKKGEGVVTAGDLVDHSNELTIVNPDQVICTLAEGGEFKARFFAKRGIGYVSSDENKVFLKDANNNSYADRIPIDSIYTPVTRVNYEVEKTRVNDDVTYDQLTMEVWTNDSINPVDAVSLAAKFLVEHFEIIATDINQAIATQEYVYEVDDKKEDKTYYDLKIEELDLSVRPRNCLKRCGIATVGDLIQKTEEEMMRVRNLGRKSLKEVQQKLREIGLDFKHSPYEGDSSEFDNDESYDEEEDSDDDDIE